MKVPRRRVTSTASERGGNAATSPDDKLDAAIELLATGEADAPAMRLVEQVFGKLPAGERWPF